jgi:transcription termination factor Rho
MNLTELKEKSINDLVELAETMKLENLARTRKQDIIFAILKNMLKTTTIFSAVVF